MAFLPKWPFHSDFWGRGHQSPLEFDGGRKDMVGVAQSVRAPDCGSGGCGFDSRLSPHLLRRSGVVMGVGSVGEERMRL